MVANPQASFMDYFKVNNRVYPDNNNEFSMSRNMFQKLLTNFHFPIQLFSIFDETFSSFLVIAVIISYKIIIIILSLYYLMILDIIIITLVFIDNIGFYWQNSLL